MSQVAPATASPTTAAHAVPPPFIDMLHLQFLQKQDALKKELKRLRAQMKASSAAMEQRLTNIEVSRTLAARV